MRSARSKSLAPSVAVLAAVILLAGSESRATVQPNSCIAGKLACTKAYAGAVFKCYATIFKKGFTAETNDKAEDCVRNARSKFGTALSSKTPCWDKVEAKENGDKPESQCPANIFDEFDVDGLVEDFTLDIASHEIAPGGAVPFGSTCSAGKVTCLSKLFAALFTCEIAAHKAGALTDQACVDKAVTKFSGGGTPAKGCFAKLEAKQKLGKLKTLCDATGNTAVAGGKATAFVAIVTGGLEP